MEAHEAVVVLGSYDPERHTVSIMLGDPSPFVLDVADLLIVDHVNWLGDEPPADGQCAIYYVADSGSGALPISDEALARARRFVEDGIRPAFAEYLSSKAPPLFRPSAGPRV